MRLAFALIADEDILYCSDESAYAYFEIVIFAGALNKQLSADKWRLHKIILTPLAATSDVHILIREVASENAPTLFYCVAGELLEGGFGYELLGDFERRLTTIYAHGVVPSMATTKREIFKGLCDEIMDVLQRRFQENADAHEYDSEEFTGETRIHYCGLSWQGLPIFSKLFDDTLTEYLKMGGEEQISRREFLESVLSAKLATIVMNSVIRAQANVHSIQILADSAKNWFHFINFGLLPNSHSFELYASGQPSRVEVIFLNLMGRLQADPTLSMPFTGDLKPYETLKSQLSEHLLEFGA